MAATRLRAWRNSGETQEIKMGGWFINCKCYEIQCVRVNVSCTFSVDSTSEPSFLKQHLAESYANFGHPEGRQEL